MLLAFVVAYFMTLVSSVATITNRLFVLMQNVNFSPMLQAIMAALPILIIMSLLGYLLAALGGRRG